MKIREEGLEMKIAVSRISVEKEERIRQDQGDIRALAESIRKVGLLNPIIVDEKYCLVAGFRRLAACRVLGWEEVEVRVVPFGEDLLLKFDAEVDENLSRKDFTPEEIISIAKRREELIRKLRGNIFQRVWRWIKSLFRKPPSP